MKNNPYYVLSAQYKIDQKKERELKLRKKLPKCIMCREEPIVYFSGELKGWCRTCEINCPQCRGGLPPVRFTGYLKGWCKTCLDMDLWIADWADACMNESCKPESEQNRHVFEGSPSAIYASLKEQ